MKSKNSIKRLFKGMYVSQYGVIDNSMAFYSLRYLNEFRNRKLEGFVARYEFDLGKLNADVKPTKEDKQILMLLEVLEEMRSSNMGDKR